MNVMYSRGTIKVNNRYEYLKERGLEIDKMPPFSTLRLFPALKSGMPKPSMPYPIFSHYGAGKKH